MLICVHQVQKTWSNLTSPLLHKITALIMSRKQDTCRHICDYTLSLFLTNSSLCSSYSSSVKTLLSCNCLSSLSCFMHVLLNLAFFHRREFFFSILMNHSFGSDGTDVYFLSLLNTHTTGVATMGPRGAMPPSLLSYFSIDSMSWFTFAIVNMLCCGPLTCLLLAMPLTHTSDVANITTCLYSWAATL